MIIRFYVTTYFNDKNSEINLLCLLKTLNISFVLGTSSIGSSADPEIYALLIVTGVSADYTQLSMLNFFASSVPLGFSGHDLVRCKRMNN